MIEDGARVYGYRFDGYWQDVGTVQSYWEANLALLSDAPELDLYDREWVIHTRSEERAPAKIGATAQVHRSLISHGCVINGSVVNSVLSPGVVVDVGAVVRDSIVLFDSIIRPGAVVDRAILDKEVAVGPGAIIGEGTDYDEVNRREPGRLNTGITVVGKRAVIPRGVRVGRNVLIGEGVRATDFPSRVVRSGSTVERPRERMVRPGARAASAETPGGRNAATGSGADDPPQPAADTGRGGQGRGDGTGAPETRRVAGEAKD